MNRDLLPKLLAWKRQPSRKPLLIDGARQTGKTYLLTRLLGQEFQAVHHYDFLSNPSLGDAFEGALTPQTVLSNLELISERRIDPKRDLLVFDEIGECPRAVTALKYFAEQAPSLFVAASGSNIGLLGSFPVGKVEQHILRPLSFHEFLQALEQPALLHAFGNRAHHKAAHEKLLEQLLNYTFTGGMPEAVQAWVDLADQGILAQTQKVRQIHGDLVAGYGRDFGKYAGATDAGIIAAIFEAVPSQLSAVLDESVQRFKFKNVHPKKARYSDLEGGISWLEKCRLVLKNYPLEGRPRSPLAAQRKVNRVKLFLHDVGLLTHMLGLGYREIQEQRFEYKGYVAENFVAQELAVAGLDPTYSWTDARAEIEFIATDQEGKVIPLEVKSGRRTRARSLQSFVTKCQPDKTIKLTGTQGSPATEKRHLVYPLYFTAAAVQDHDLA